MQSFRMIKLTITWQRLVEQGQTCPRCGSTEAEIERAAVLLSNALVHLGIAVELQKKEMSLEEFSRSPLSSNQILINGKTLEEWLGAKTGQSQCCDVCGDNECRTVELGSDRFESIPASMIIKAGLMAAAEVLSVNNGNVENTMLLKWRL